ncbi:MAG: InlB B-repeat-containing protein [Spirochaetaceae bacterium]|nr:InlB B-repeat-containing protein [Spirochaetaceae bacterium]
MKKLFSLTLIAFVLTSLLVSCPQGSEKNGTTGGNGITTTGGTNGSTQGGSSGGSGSGNTGGSSGSESGNSSEPSTPKTYIVTFEANGGSGTMQPQVFAENEEKELNPVEFAKEAHNFQGWATSSTGDVVYADKAKISPTNDMTLWAKWEAIPTYTVTFNANGGSGTMQPQVFVENVEQALSPNTFIKEDYYFVGWAITQAGETMYTDKQIIAVLGNVELYAVWALRETYTVEFHPNGGYNGGSMSMSPQTFKQGIAAKLSKNLFHRLDHAFAGWSTTKNGEVEYVNEQTIIVERNMKLYAIWTLTAFKVTFNANGGIGKMEPQTFEKDKEWWLSENTFTRTNYVFAGWATSPTDEIEYVNNQKITVENNMTLYAVWRLTGSAGPDCKYISFGEWPQSVLPQNSTVTVNESQSKIVGMFTYYRGSDGNWYVKQAEDRHNNNKSLKYSDGTNVKPASEKSTRYFKVEPIKWRVLEEKDGKKFLIAENGLIVCSYYPYGDVTKFRNIDGEHIYANNYKYSRIRAWLNGLSFPTLNEDCTDYKDRGFLQTAFVNNEQTKITITTVDNSPTSTGYSPNPYSCEDTHDKVFLLSVKEVLDTRYGFSPSTESDNTRIRKPTDFALATGAFAFSTSDTGSIWLLRSPYYSNRYGSNLSAFFAYNVDEISRILLGGYGTVVPALWVENGEWLVNMN